jgi:hypothetical protein
MANGVTASAAEIKLLFDVTAALAQIRIVAIDHYWDSIGIGFRDPPSQSTLNRWQRRCGEQHYIDDKPRRFDPTVKLRVNFHQPQMSVLRELAKYPDHSVDFNYAEPASDLITLDDASNCLLATTFVHGYWRPHSRRDPDSWSRRTGLITGFSTRKTPNEGERRDGVWDQWYNDLESRLRHTPHCFHFETRMQGEEDLAANGIRHLRDLLSWPFEPHFTKVMVLRELDLDRLGRWNHNHCTGRKRKRADIAMRDGREVNLDIERGYMLWRTESVHRRTADEEHGLERIDRSLQQFMVAIDRDGPYPFLSPPIPYYAQLIANARPARLPGGYHTLLCSCPLSLHISSDQRDNSPGSARSPPQLAL